MTDKNRKLLIFSLNGSHFALDLKQVAEVGDSPQLSPVPLAPVCCSGAYNFHGDVVAVMDLGVFLGIAGCADSGKIIVLLREVASLAFIVETIIRIVPEEEILSSEPSDAPFTSGRITFSDGVAARLDLDAIILSAEKRMLEAG